MLPSRRSDLDALSRSVIVRRRSTPAMRRRWELTDGIYSGVNKVDQAALAGPAGKTPDITINPLMRLTRSHQRRIAG